MRGSWRRLSLLALVVALVACNESGDSGYRPVYARTAPVSGRVLEFGIHPLHNPETLFQVYQPLVDYLNARLGGPVLKLEASRSYAAFDARLVDRQFAIALPNSYEITLAQDHGYHSFAKFDDDREFRGIILVRRDSGIKQVSDLKGKAVSYPAPTALAATMLPQAFLVEHGIDLRRDIENIYVGSQESSILSVYLGKVAAGATWPPPWIKFQRDDPAKAAQLEVKWDTRSLPHNGFVARDDVPPELVARLTGLLTALDRTDEGRALLARVPVARIVPTVDQAYQPTRDFIRWFSATIRKPEEP